METYFYLAVRLAAVGYILYRLWIFLFCNGERLWKWIPVIAPKPKTIVVRTTQVREPEGVVGRTNVVVLSDTRVAPQPVHTTPLEPTGYIGEDGPLNPSDIETNHESQESGYMPSDDELYGDDPIPDDPEFSSGITFEDIGNAVDVLKSPIDDENRLVSAAKTMRHLQNTDIFDVIVKEVCRLETIEKLMKEHLDSDGFPINKKIDRIEDIQLRNFDIAKFV